MCASQERKDPAGERLGGAAAGGLATVLLGTMPPNLVGGRAHDPRGKSQLMLFSPNAEKPFHATFASGAEAAVPEPANAVGLAGLAGMGLIGLVWRRRRTAA
jgi:hypothetical protein